MNCFTTKKKNKIINDDLYNNLKNKHIKELNELNDAIKSLKNKKIILSKEIDILEKNRKENRQEKDELYLCKICFSNRANICFFPCGHIVCDKCIGNNDQCYYCRRNIQIKQSMYFN